MLAEVLLVPTPAVVETVVGELVGDAEPQPQTQLSLELGLEGEVVDLHPLYPVVVEHLLAAEWIVQAGDDRRHLGGTETDGLHLWEEIGIDVRHPREGIGIGIGVVHGRILLQGQDHALAHHRPEDHDEIDPITESTPFESL